MVRYKDVATADEKYVQLGNAVQVQKTSTNEYMLKWYNSNTGVWEDVFKIITNTKEIVIIPALRDDVKLFLGTDKDYSLYYDSTSDWVVLRDEINAVDVLRLKRNGDIEIIRDAVIGRNLSITGNVLTDISINKSTPAVRLIGTETGAKDLSIRENAGRIEIYDNAAAKVIKFLPQLNFDSGLVGLTIGTGGAWGTATDLVTAEDMENLLPTAVYMEVGGTVATGETVDIEVRAVTDAGDEIVIASYSVTGTTGSTTVGADTITTNLLNNARAGGISLDGKRIVAIRGYARTSATSTTATASAQVIGKRV